jgi:hypothetical protein
MNASQISAILASIKSVAEPGAFEAAVAQVAPEKSKKVRVPKDEKELPGEVIAGEKPKRVLSEEHKAKMQAGRKKAAAEKAAKPEGAKPEAEKPEAEKPKRVLTEEHKAKMQEGRKKAAAAAAEAKPKPTLLIPPNAVAAAMVASATEEIQVAGKTYIRLSDGRCYEPGTIDGELGAWAGLFKNGVLDTTAVE